MRRIGIVVVAVWATSLVSAEGRAARCTNGRFVSSAPLIPDATTTNDTVVLFNGNVSIGATCPRAAARLRGKGRFDLVKARLEGCAGEHATLKLVAKIDATDCRTMTGKLSAKKPKPRLRTRFSAVIPAGGAVGGALVVPPTAFADADTADAGQNGDNDTIATAQPIPVFATVGGAAFIAGATDFDDDIYRIELTGSPVSIRLTIANPDASDLDLYLVDADGNDIVSPSTGTADVEELHTSTQTGTAYIGVITYLGTGSPAPNPITNYVLAIGQSGASTVADAPADAEFVPGEMIVRLRNDVSMVAQGRVALAADEAAHVAGDPAGAGGGLYRLSPPATLARAAAADRRAETLAAIAEMRARPDVLWAEPNYIRRPMLEPNDEFYALQWHYPLIALPEAWDITTGSANVIVAVIDTGLLIGHPDIDSGRLAPGFDFILDPGAARDGNGIDSDPFDEGDLGNGGSSSFHGTHVAGTIGAATNNTEGVAGVDWAGKIMPIRVLGVGGGTAYDIAQGIRYAAGLANDSGTVPPQRADIINMSLGGPGASSTERAAVQAARAAGVTIVAAAGNSNQDAANFSPASFPECVAVSATDLRRLKAPYSNFGAVVDLTAPGGDTSVDRNGDGFADGVLSTLGDDSGPGIVPSYVFYQGTSMAAPHVAGVAALMQAAFMDANSGARYTPDEFEALLQSGAITDDLGATNFDGAGIVNARLAVEAAGGTPTGPPNLITVPPALNFGADLAAAELLLRNGGTGTVTVTSVTVDPGAAWLTATPDVGLPTAAPVTVQLTVDRSGLTPGVYNAIITAESDSGTRMIQVAVIAGASGGGGDVGPVYALLLDPDSRATLVQATTTVSEGYLLSFGSDVPAGRYLVIAGTDRDNDGFIGDAGEALGLYPSSAGPQPIELSENGNLEVVLPVIEQVSLVASQGTDTTAHTGYRRLR